MYALPVSIVFLALAVVSVLLRLYTRLWFVRTPGWDDLFIVVALLVDVAFFTFLVLEIHYGLGQHQADLSPHYVHEQLKALWISIPLYNLTLNLAKVSVTLLYMRLFTTKGYRIILITTLVIIIITGLWMVLSAFFFCLPVHAFWDMNVADAYCLPDEVIWPLNASTQITTDIALVILPMPVLFGLRLPRRQKCAVIMMFALGTFVCVTSVIRLVALVELIHTDDLTRENTATAVWSFIESNVAIICACLPPLRPLLAHYFPRLMPSRARTSYQQRDKPTAGDLLTNPFSFADTSYSASVTGNCSTNNDGRQEPSTPQPPQPEGTIQVTSELRWHSDAESADEKHSEDRLDPAPEGGSSV